MINKLKNNINIFIKEIILMGIGDWGLGIGDWGLGPIPNPQSPNNSKIFYLTKINLKIINFTLKLINIYIY